MPRDRPLPGPRLTYVPALSDVDIHVLLSAEAAPAFHEPATALDVQARREEHFAVSAPDAMHVPRPQINLLNELKQNDNDIRRRRT